LEVFLEFYERYANFQRQANHQHIAIRGDYREVLERLPTPVSVIYADPPYTRDHYSRFYHVLETVALGDDPKIDQSNLGARMSRGFYRAERVQSDFCIKSKAPAAFEDLFRLSAHTGAPLLLSYSAFDGDRGGRPRLLSIRDVLAIGRRHYRQVETVELDGADHSKLTSVAMTKGAGTTTEVLFACQEPVR
jgi:adenine-specific DNA methylase